MKSGNPYLSADIAANPAKAHAAIKEAVARSDGNLSEAARKLGITKRTLSRWLEMAPAFAREIRAK